jgi:hypothetical protein|nr:MAG TPA: hypothetical protein [Bacteriophage sp.]
MNYLLVITCDVNEDDYITNATIIDDNELNDLIEELKVVNNFRKKFSVENPKTLRDYRDDLPYYGRVRDFILKPSRWNNYNFFGTPIDKDLELFENFDERLPFLSGVEVRSIVSIEIYELSNKEPIKLV